MPGIGISVFIAAVGAIMRYAVTASAQGFNIHTGGVILMFIGAAGVLLSLVFWTSLSPWGRGRTADSRRVETRTDNGRESGRVVSETHERSSS